MRINHSLDSHLFEASFSAWRERCVGGDETVPYYDALETREGQHKHYKAQKFDGRFSTTSSGQHTSITLESACFCWGCLARYQGYSISFDNYRV